MMQITLHVQNSTGVQRGNFRGRKEIMRRRFSQPLETPQTCKSADLKEGVCKAACETKSKKRNASSQKMELTTEAINCQLLPSSQTNPSRESFFIYDTMFIPLHAFLVALCLLARIISLDASVPCFLSFWCFEHQGDTPASPG